MERYPRREAKRGRKKVVWIVESFFFLSLLSRAKADSAKSFNLMKIKLSCTMNKFLSLSGLRLGGPPSRLLGERDLLFGDHPWLEVGVRRRSSQSTEIY